MNALPIKNSPRDVIDDLVASFGLRRVIMAVAVRTFRRTRPPDSGDFPDLAKQPGVDELSNHLRRDLGLPPEPPHRVYIDPIILKHGRF